jgi:hypothetical protein
MPPAKSKTNLAKKKFESRAKFKHTHQGNGTRSLPKGTKKLRRGQGK